MHQLKSQTKLQSKYMESTPSYLEISSNLVSTEVDYTAAINTKPTKQELKLMSNAERRRLWKNIVTKNKNFK